MKKGYLIGGIIIAIGVGIASYALTSKLQVNQNTIQTSINILTQNSSNIIKPTFTTQEQSTYYKLSQNVGDIGMPSASMTTNLNEPKEINGVAYYKTYSYDTRAAYQNDTSTPTNNNYSHLIDSKIISLNGASISNDLFGTLNTSELSNTQIENEIAKIAAMYVEGYTANNPSIKPGVNDDYESNLNEIPIMSVNLNITKNINNETLYNVIVTLNNKQIPIYVGLDGYIYIASENYFNELFFPNKVK